MRMDDNPWERDEMVMLNERLKTWRRLALIGASMVAVLLPFAIVGFFALVQP